MLTSFVYPVNEQRHHKISSSRAALPISRIFSRHPSVNTTMLVNAPSACLRQPANQPPLPSFSYPP